MIYILCMHHLSPILKCFRGGTFEDFTTTKTNKQNHKICLIRNNSTFYCQSNAPPQTGECPHPWVLGVSDYRIGGGYNALARRF